MYVMHSAGLMGGLVSLGCCSGFGGLTSMESGRVCEGLRLSSPGGDALVPALARS